MNHAFLDKSSGCSDSEQKSLVTAGLVGVEQWTVSPPPASLLSATGEPAVKGALVSSVHPPSRFNVSNTAPLGTLHPPGCH